MATAKMTTKGQITVPKEIREALGLREGDEIEFISERGTVVVRRRLPPGHLKKYRGYLNDLASNDPDALVREMRGE